MPAMNLPGGKLPDHTSGVSPGQFGKILVADDEETMRRSLADILRLEGYQVLAVASGEAAVDALRAAQGSGSAPNEFDVVLLDLKMPGMDGLEVLRAAARIAPDTMVILLTAHGSLDSAIEAIHYQAHDYLLKPATPQQIVNSVTKAIGRRAEFIHKRAVMGQRGAFQTPKRDVGDLETEPRVISLSKEVVVDLARREIWQREDVGGQAVVPKSAAKRTEKERHRSSAQSSIGRKLNGERIRLTPTEAKLLKVLLENRGRVLTHRELVLLVQGYEVTDWEAPEVLRPLVSRLRQKLHHFPGGDRWIVNVRGTGYVLERRQKDDGPTDGVERRHR